MRKLFRSTSKTAQPTCTICNGVMNFKCTIPAAHIFPELKRFQCVGCGTLRTVEDEHELFIEENLSVAA